MKYFLDFGTHFFDTNHEGNIGKCPNGLLYHKNIGYMDDGKWIVKTYEPSKSIYESNIPYLDEVSAYFYKFESINAAILDRNGTIKFKMYEGNPAGSNCVEDELYIKDYSDESKRDVICEYEIKCIDVFDIVTEIINNDEEAEIHIKCDIEGSEFKVLPRLLQIKNLEKYLKKIFVEWHERLWELNPKYDDICKIKEEILNICNLKNIEIVSWY